MYCNYVEYIDTNRHGKVFLGAREIRDFFSRLGGFFFFLSKSTYVSKLLSPSPN